MGYEQDLQAIQDGLEAGVITPENFDQLLNLNIAHTKEDNDD